MLLRLMDFLQNSLYSSSLFSSYSAVFFIVTSLRLTCVCSFSSEFETSSKHGCSGTSFSPCLPLTSLPISLLSKSRQQISQSSSPHERFRSHIQQIHDHIIRIVHFRPGNVSFANFRRRMLPHAATSHSSASSTCMFSSLPRGFHTADRTEFRRFCS